MSGILLISAFEFQRNGDYNLFPNDRSVHISKFIDLHPRLYANLGTSFDFRVLTGMNSGRQMLYKYILAVME